MERSHWALDAFLRWFIAMLGQNSRYGMIRSMVFQLIN